MVADTEHIRSLADRLQKGITEKCDGVVLNGPQSTDHRYVGNMNLSFSYVEGESLIMGLKVTSPRLSLQPVSMLWRFSLVFTAVHSSRHKLSRAQPMTCEATLSKAGGDHSLAFFPCRTVHYAQDAHVIDLMCRTWLSAVEVLAPVRVWSLPMSCVHWV